MPTIHNRAEALDNLAHTLVGAAIGQAGLKRRTGLAMATLMIAANLPDIDVIGLPFGENLAWRRGWTHGPIALFVLPLFLAAAMVGFDRWQHRRGTRPPGRIPVRPGWVLALAYIGILSHPLLDLLNTYGVRCLMPFSDRWFYGDVLFIIDIWFWILLAAGIWQSRRMERLGRTSPGIPAVIALALVVVYVGAMGVAGRLAERRAASEIVARGFPRPDRVLANPVFANPFRRHIIFATKDAYGFGDFRWLPTPRLTLRSPLVATGMSDPAIARAARHDKRVADFLYWSRYPFAIVRRRAGGSDVALGDARYDDSPEDGRFVVRAFVADQAAGVRLAD